jgi:hypothetical protein
VPWYQTDDFRLALERICGDRQHPVLRAFDDRQAVSRLPVEALLQRRIEIAQLTSFALEKVIDSHIATGVPVILEGDDITPALAAQQWLATGPTIPPSSVQPVFVIEEDPAAIASAMACRGRGYHGLSAAAQGRFVALSCGYGAWLSAEAERYDLPVLAAQPWDTLEERILDQLTV